MGVLTINYIFIAIFSALVIFAAFEDVRRFIIPNWIPTSIVVLFLLSVLFSSNTELPLFPTSVFANFLTFAGVLVFFTILFATGQMGGGDVKLISAISLWAGPYFVFDFILITALVGGVVAAVQLVRNGQAKAQTAIENVVGETIVNTQNIQPKTQQKSVPYGLAIGVGGLYLAQQLFNQLN